MAKSNILKDTIPVEGYRGLFIKNTVGLKRDKLTKKDYGAFKKEKELLFVMRTTSPRDTRRQLSPIRVVGKSMNKILGEADDERQEIIKELKSGISRREIEAGEGAITIEDLWKEYTSVYLGLGKMTANYVKNNTYFFNKHMKPLFMPYKKKNEKIAVRYEEEGSIKTKIITVGVPEKDGQGKPIIDEKKIVYIKDITTPDKLLKQLIEMNSGGYTRTRIDKGTKERYVEWVKYKPATAHQFLKVFHSMFDYAVKKKYMSINPMDTLEAPEYQNGRKLNLSEKKQKELYNALMNYSEIKFRAIFMFLLNGRRKNEVLSLKWDDVDFETMTYSIWYYNNKNKQNYTYALPEHLEMTLKMLSNGKDRTGLVFKSDKTGGKINNFDKRWDTLMQKLGITDFTRHDTRHWIGTLAVNTGKTTAEVAYALGHNDERTARRYAETRHKAAAKVGDDFHKHFKG